MNLRNLAAAAVLALTALAAPAAQAQAGIYLNPVVIRVSNSTADTGPFAFLGAGKTSQIFYGVNLGGYYDFLHLDRADIGIDVRDSITRANNASLNSFLVGLRISGSPFQRPLRPYAQVSVGAGTTKAPTNSLHITKLQYGVFAGADYALNKHFDWRIVEVGYNSLQTISSSSVGGSNVTIPGAGAISFSTGFVLRFQ